MEEIEKIENQLQIDIKEKKFGDTPIINDLMLNIKEGGIISLLGRSGVGKTTLLKILAGLDQSYKGSVLLEQKRLSEPTSDIALMFQGHRLLPWLTVKKNIKFINSEIQDEEIISYLKKVGIENKENSWPNQLSGGEKTRAALSVALLNKCKVLLLDEPFSDIDIKVKNGVIKLLKEIKFSFNTTILLTTHNIDDALSFTERVIVLGKSPATIIFDSKIDSKNVDNLKGKLVDILTLD